MMPRGRDMDSSAVSLAGARNRKNRAISLTAASGWRARHRRSQRRQRLRVAPECGWLEGVRRYVPPQSGGGNSAWLSLSRD